MTPRKSRWDRAGGVMDDGLRQAVEERLGALAEIRRLDRGSQARVWRVRTGQGASAIVKQSHDAASHRREVAAYDAWGDALGAWVPRRLAFLPTVGALVLEWVAGRPASDPGVDPASRLVLHREAGRFVAALERLDVPADPLPLHEALPRRLDAWIDRAQGFFPKARLASLRARFDPQAFVGVTRVAAHRDLSPDNWLLVDGAPPRLVVLDFGQARADAPLTDLLKLWDRPWRETPGAEAAFFEGYGRPLSIEERERLHQLGILHGLATATWGREHDVPHFAALGDAILERLTGPSSRPSSR